MRVKFKFILLLPIVFSNISCSSSDKITFQTDSDTFETYYNDYYFMTDNSVYSEEIALASHAMALATFNEDEDYTNRSNYLRDLWKKEGFDIIWMSDSYYRQPETDSIGYGIAAKEVQLMGGKFTLVAIAVRGGNYDGEWASNVTLGKEGNAQGFDEASNQVLSGLNDFLNNYSISGNIKIWISGFSRAAITSNMVAGKILNRLEEGEYLGNNVSYRDRDIFAYCFEPPMGVYTSIENARKSLYGGIHNLLNYNDIVPLVAPVEWGFTRYGVDHYYPDRLNDIFFDRSEREKLLSMYQFTYGAHNFPKYTVDEWEFFDVGETIANEHNLPRESIHPSQGRFSRAFIQEFANVGVGSRQMWNQYVEYGIRELMATIFGLNPKIDKIKIENLTKMIFEYDFIQTMILEIQQDQPSNFASDVRLLFLQAFNATEENMQDVSNLYMNLYPFLVMFGMAFKNRKDVLAQLFYRDNAMGLIIGHIPSLSYAFLRACDSRFNGEGACQLNDGNYYILRIDNPDEFSLMEKQLKKEVFTYKDGVMESNCLSAEKYADGHIDIYLPKNGHYEYVTNGGSLSLYNVDPLEKETPINVSLPLLGTIG